MKVDTDQSGEPLLSDLVALLSTQASASAADAAGAAPLPLLPSVEKLQKLLQPPADSEGGSDGNDSPKMLPEGYEEGTDQ